MGAAEVREMETARCVLSERLLRYLHGLQPALREDVSAALALEGKLLHRPAADLDGRWALLPFYLTRDLRTVHDVGPIGADPSYDVALAMECIVCATDLLDDVMDNDTTPLVVLLGVARVLNAALALVSLSQRVLIALLDLNLPVALPMRLLDMVQHAIMRASAGQQQDLLAERRLACDLTREECLEIAAAKAGALLGLACQMGALCAGAEETCIEHCAEMGRLLGIAAQLDNDAHDLYGLLQPTGSQHTSKSDLVRSKKTLPVVLAARSLQKAHTLDARTIDFCHLDLLAEKERDLYLAALREGILTTWGIALLYRERAWEALCTLMGQRAVSSILCQILGFDDMFMRIKNQ